MINFEGEFAKKVYKSKKILSPFGLMSDFNFSRRTVAGFLIDISTQIIWMDKKKEIGLQIHKNVCVDQQKLNVVKRDGAFV